MYRALSQGQVVKFHSWYPERVCFPLSWTPHDHDHAVHPATEFNPPSRWSCATPRAVVLLPQ